MPARRVLLLFSFITISNELTTRISFLSFSFLFYWSDNNCNGNGNGFLEKERGTTTNKYMQDQQQQATKQQQRRNGRTVFK